MSKRVLVLGGSGRFGRNATQAFQAAGWDVRQFNRATEDLRAAADGTDVIVNAWNPPYPDWADQVPRLHEQVQAAALAAEATVILPGNVYVFGAHTPSPWSERSAHAARNPLGRIRIQIERMYREGGGRTIVLRSGDYIDTEASGNWFDRVMTPALAKGRFVYPGNPDIPHAWGFLPDLCRAAVLLAEQRADLPDFADIPFPGYAATGNELATALAQVTGHQVRLSRMSWLPFRVAQPFWPMARSLLEMRYLWDTPHQLDGARFSALLPGFDHTHLEDALAQAVRA